jgi:hypothetical protein
MKETTARGPLRSVVETLVLIWADDNPEDWQNAITIIPF